MWCGTHKWILKWKKIDQTKCITKNPGHHNSTDHFTPATYECGVRNRGEEGLVNLVMCMGRKEVEGELIAALAWPRLNHTGLEAVLAAMDKINTLC